MKKGCTNPHKKDTYYCYDCGRRLSGDIIRFAKLLGASKVICSKCSKITKHP